MLKIQKPYDFKTELLEVHKKDRRDKSLTPREDEFAFPEEVRIVLLDNSDVILTAARDFTDYLFTSMGISGFITEKQKPGEPAIEISLSKNLGDFNAYMGYRITVKKDGITIEGYDERGVAQALYYLEDLMNLRKAPFLTKGVIQRKSLFTYRNTQSPLGMFAYTDEALALIAHMGMDSISVWIKDPYTTKRGEYIDLRLLSERAAKYGIDVYIELTAAHSKHPDEPDAEEFYEELYGKLFEVCPKLKGIALVGEANQFKSRDPRVGKTPWWENFVDNIPTGKTSPGWWPCCDYPEWVALIQKVVTKYNPDVDLIFCTYNWGFAPEEDRVKLIERLPKGISLLATWDMFHQFKLGNSVQNVADYSLSFVGPGEYFASEAIAAKKRGIKLYSISMTAGRTWDFGVVPYEPMGQQWIKRYEKVQQAQREWGLTGLLENHHYGFHPSIICELEKCAFFTPVKPLIESLRDLLVRDFGEEDAVLAEQAMEKFSEAITYYPPSNEEQYGAFRIGPSYPLWSGNYQELPQHGKLPDRAHAMFGNDIYFGAYRQDFGGRNSLSGVRIMDEIPALQTMERLMLEGIALLESSKAPNDALLRMCNLAKFMQHTIRTGIHVKQHFILKQQLSIAGNQAAAAELLNQMEELLLAERENVLATIPIVQVDSRLGWEPSMEYTTDEYGLRWKLRQLDYELEYALADYRKANALTAE
ncbi:MAG: hypothetical protein E7293_07185 [Lachnospiraceae bacterium]|nr:hypothetical protein [Lachnospiraceae bacterium]